MDKIKADNGEFVSSEEVMYKVIYYLLSKYAVQDLSTLLVLTVPSATRDLDDACKFLEKVSRKVKLIIISIILYISLEKHEKCTHVI